MNDIFTEKKRFTLIIYLLILLCLSVRHANAQTCAWNSGSFKFSRDSVSLADMAGASTVSFSGVLVSTALPVSVPGFSFHFGLKSYSSFYVSPYGFIKLGSQIVTNNPEKDSTVIAALYNGTNWGASYKVTGSAPNRKLIIQFDGVMQPSGEPTKFQIWLSERTGTIQFVYAHLRGFYGYSSYYNYKIFCSADILNKRTSVYAKVNPGNTSPDVNYQNRLESYDSIYAKTRYTFQPDTIKPSVPSSLHFTNVEAGCLTANLTENSNNESLIALERADIATNYRIQTMYFTDSSMGSTQYIFPQITLQPLWKYSYRAYVSNGFLNSDTLYNSVVTLAPQINGVVKVPGDYPSITALLSDAFCKHLGPNLIIELQKNYSFASETLPLSFRPGLQTRLIESIVIRPAADANIIWSDSIRGPLFYVDSVKHVFLDGRPGGTGTSQNLTLFQRNTLGSVIQYTNMADSGGITYCKILSKNFKYSSAAIKVVPGSNSSGQPKKNVNALSIKNNFISADALSVSQLIYITTADSTEAIDFVISGNQFSRFRNSAIHFEGGGANLRVENNVFFQPESFQAEVFLPYTYASCISLLNTGKATVTGNYFGGGSPVWGKGKFTLAGFSSNFSFINYQNTSTASDALIANNKFGNIASLGSQVKLIFASGGNVTIDNNRFGTADSTNSITNTEYFWALDIGKGSKKVSNNFFSGFQGGYQNSGTSNDSYFITGARNVINNDIGGSDNPEANSSTGRIHGIYLAYDSASISIKGNILRGMSSKSSSVTVISGDNGLSGAPQNNVQVDSNSIHDIQAAKTVIGIALNLNSTTRNTVSYNNIYALKTTGIVRGDYGPTGTLSGINYSIYNMGVSPVNVRGEVAIFGNRIHSFESVRKLPNSIFSYSAINVRCPVSKIYNNDIRFGIDSKGQFIDSATTLTGITIAPLDHQILLSDKHYIEHNTIYFGGKGTTMSCISVQYDYNYVSPRNSVTITNNILNVEREPLVADYISSATFENISSIKALSAKNLWYSSTISNTPALLQAYQKSCNCDSSSFVGDPVFVNARGTSANFNLNLDKGSKADGTGTPSVLPIANDIDNKNRNAYSPVDVGSHAATPCGIASFPVINITNPMADTLQLCYGRNFVLKASISGGSFTHQQWQRNLIDSAGANADSLIISEIGLYRLVGTNACGAIASRTIYVVSDPLQPKVTAETRDYRICSTDTAVFIAETMNAGANPSYQWQVNGNNEGSNGSTFSVSGLADNSQVKVILTSNYCGSATSVESNIITMKVAVSPVANAGRDTTICAGGYAQLSGAGGTYYSWSPANALNNPYTANPVATPKISTNYVLTVKNDAGCEATDSLLLTVLTPSYPSANIMIADSVICFGTPVIFTAAVTNGGANPVYQWQLNGANTGSNANVYTADNFKTGDKINLMLTSDAACLVTKTVSSNVITMDVQQLSAPELSASGTVITVQNPENDASYVWQINYNGAWLNVDPLTEGNTYMATSSGDYRVEAKKGKCVLFSDPRTVTMSGLRRSDNPFGIYLYPNPANRTITLDSIMVSQKWEILSMSDILGNSVLTPIDIKNKVSVVINISMLSKGVYFVRLKRHDGHYTTLKFVRY